MTARVPLTLLLVALALAAYIVAFERGRPGASELSSRAGFILDEVVPERVDEIGFNDGQSEIVIQRTGEGFEAIWSIAEPVRASADGDRVRDFLRSWEYAAPLRRLELTSDEDLGRFGVDTPKSTVRFGMGPTTVRATLGTATPPDGAAYVRIDERSEVMVVGDDVAALFDRTLEELKAEPDAGALDLDDLE